MEQTSSRDTYAVDQCPQLSWHRRLFLVIHKQAAFLESTLHMLNIEVVREFLVVYL